jgi:murein DD-endopeptidase MepM/ murein hydrolase activator NlpD
MHEGIDIAHFYGTSVTATARGTVEFSGVKSGYGKIVILNHGFGLETIYSHASTVAVKAGQKVKRGQIIASMGNTGRSTGPHVHYEVRVNGIPKDPLTYLLEN